MALLSLIARLGLNKSGFDQGLKAAGREVSMFANQAKGWMAGAFGAAAIAAYVGSLLNLTGRIKDLSDQYGITTDEMQRADYALKQNGLEFETLAATLGKLGTARRDAAEENMELRDTFGRYGVTLNDLQNPQLRTYDILLKIAKALSGTNITAREQVELMDLLGPRAAKLVNVIGDLEKSDIPPLFSNEDIVAIDEAAKALRRFNLELKTTLGPLAGGVANQLTTALGTFRVWRQSMGEWFKPGTVKERAARAEIAWFEGIEELAFPRKAREQVIGQIQQGVGGFIRNVLGIPKPEEGPLFKPPPDGGAAKFQGADIFAGTPIEQQSLGRIGAFGGGGSVKLAEQMRANTKVLQDIKAALTQRGIKILDL